MSVELSHAILIFRLPWDKQEEHWETFLQGLAAFAISKLSVSGFGSLSVDERLEYIPQDVAGTLSQEPYCDILAWPRLQKLLFRGLPLCRLHAVNQNDPILQAGPGHAFFVSCGNTRQECLVAAPTWVLGPSRHFVASPIRKDSCCC